MDQEFNQVSAEKDFEQILLGVGLEEVAKYKVDNLNAVFALLFRELMKSNPNNEEYAHKYALHLHDVVAKTEHEVGGRQLVEFLRSAVEKFPESYKLQWQLAATLYDTNNKEDADKEFQKAKSMIEAIIANPNFESQSYDFQSDAKGYLDDVNYYMDEIEEMNSKVSVLVSRSVAP